MEEQKEKLERTQGSESPVIEAPRVLHPSFYHYFKVLLIPLALLGFIPAGS